MGYLSRMGRRIPRRVMAGAAALGMVGAMHAQTERIACNQCGSDGIVECGKHGKAWLPRERAVAFCSHAAECKVCSGVLDADCKACRNATAEQELARRVELVRNWRRGLRTAIDDVAKGAPLLHLKTAHVDLSFGIDKLTVGRDKLDTHAAIHLYGDRLEALRASFVTTLALDDKDFSTRLRIYVCRDGEQSARLAPSVTGIGGNLAVGTKLLGIDAVYCCWQDPRSLPDDASLHRNLVHNGVHLLLSNMDPPRPFGNPQNGWLDEGLAHWFEEKVDGKCTNFCFEEVLMQSGASFKAGRWRVPVRKFADEGKLVSLAALGQKNTDQLDFPEHAQSFAMVDCLLATHGGPKLRDFLRAIKSGTPMRDAMQAVYGTTPLKFDIEFDTWVKANYSPQESPR